MKGRMRIAAVAVLGLAFAGPAAAEGGVNGRIAFCAADGQGARGLFTMAADGSDVRRVSTGYHNHPEYSPDGTQIVFDAYASGSSICFNDPTSGGQDVWLIAADGTGSAINLTGDKGKLKEAFPSWSPDGAHIVFGAVEKGQNGDLWIVSPDGSGRARLTSGPANDRQPAWSPDGSTIAFIRDFDVYTMPAPGVSGALRRLTFTSSPEYYPEWSPDGTTLLFGTDDAGGEIYAIAPDGSGKRAMTRFPGADGAASWSPDGQLIVFNSWRDGVAQGQLFVMPASGDGYTTDPTGSPSDDATRLTDLPFGAWWADWQRVESPQTGCLPVPLPC